MPLHVNIETQWFLQFLLVFSRISPILASPIFVGPVHIPRMAKIIILFGISYLITSTLDTYIYINDGIDLAVLLFTEVINGLFLLLGVYCAVYVLELAGRLVDYQGGLSAASVFNPSSKEQSSIFGTLLLFLFVFFFYTFDVHHELLMVLKHTFTVFPVGQNMLDGGLSLVIVHLSKMAILGILLAAPVCIPLFLIDVVAGLVSKSMPQVNVYFLLLPVKIFVCMLMFLLTVKNSLLVFDKINHSLLDFVAY